MDLKLQSVVLFDVSSDVPHKTLTRATDEGLAAARAAIQGAVEANGSLGSARGETRRVRIDLSLRVTEGGATAALAAERAFAEAFLARIRAIGLDGERVEP